MQCYVAVREEGVLKCATKWTDLENAMLSERRQSQWTHIARFHFYEAFRTEKPRVTEGTLVIAQGREEHGTNLRVTAQGRNASFWGD